MPDSLLPLGTGFQMLGLALMAGGMLALGAFTAPVVFKSLPRELAAPVMAVIFRRFDVVLLIALLLVLAGEAMRFFSRMLPVRSKLSMIRYLLLAALSGGILYSTLAVNADIERMNRAGWRRDVTTAQGQAFERAHKLSETLYKIDLLAAVLLIALTPYVGFRTRRQGGTA